MFRALSEAAMAKEDRDYLLGTYDDEIARLGLQHRVWRPRVLDAWRRAGVTTGTRIIDAGAGPGWASIDLAEIVGPKGRVEALERSERFLDYLDTAARQRGLVNIHTHKLDLVADSLPVGDVDAFWIRWVLAFVSDPLAVLHKLADALKPGGVAIIHEYLDYATWSLAPSIASHEEFREFVIKDWRATGGEPDIARSFPTLLPQVGLRVKELRPIVDVIGPSNYVWEWPASFIDIYPTHLAEAGKVTKDWAERVRGDFHAAERDPNTVMVTPMVLEVIAEKA
jgi:SAM-dependent methyltransferase